MHAPSYALAARPVVPPDFSVLYARFRPPVQAKCRRLLGGTGASDDVVQETFVRLWKADVASEENPRVVMAWLYRTCTRLSIDVLRDRKRTQPRDLTDEPLPCGVDLAASTEARAAIAALADAVSEDELAVAVLCRVDGLSQLEAATLLEVSERTVRRMLDRFDERTRSLRKELSS